MWLLNPRRTKSCDKACEVPADMASCRINYPNEAKAEIKALTVKIHNNEITHEARILLMKELNDIGENFLSSPDVQRSFCHAISNVGMQSEYAQLLIALDVQDLLLKILQVFIGQDWKVCWLGCSALWNLARPSETRAVFDQRIIDMILQCMKCHREESKLVNTVLGALSNLSLNDDLKSYVGLEENLGLIIEAFELHFRDYNVACTGCGLIANLAIDDEIASQLVDLNGINIVTSVADLHWEILETENHINFRKNLVASLSNMSTSPEYMKRCVQTDAIDLFFQCLRDFHYNIDLVTLIHSALDALQLSNMRYTTSLHVACREGWLEETREILNRRSDRLMFEIDDDDLHPIDYANQKGHYKIVNFLVALGSPHPQVTKSRKTQIAVLGGMKKLNLNFRIYANIISSSCMLTHDPALLISSYCSPYELHIARQRKYDT